MVVKNSKQSSYRHGFTSQGFPAVIVKEGAGVPDDVSTADCVTQRVLLEELKSEK